MLKAHFGHITYDVEFVDELDHHGEDREGPYGYSDHPTRQIKVAHQGEQREEYAANTLLHELMHAAADVVGFHPENEEEAVHALTAGLMFFLRDSRNAALVARLTDEPVTGEPSITDEPTVGEQVTDSDGDVWQRFEGGWRWWGRIARHWSSWIRTWDDLQTHYDPLRATTDDDRRRVGLPIRDENTPSASQNDSQEAPVDSQAAPGPQKSAGRIGWLRLDSSFPFRYLAREVEGGWSGVDLDHNNGVPGWTDTGYPEVTFTPLLDGFFVAPDGENVPTIWRETDGEPVWVMVRTPYFAAFFDAVAGLLETREEA